MPPSDIVLNRTRQNRVLPCVIARPRYPRAAYIARAHPRRPIAYYTQVNGLVLDTKEHDRAFLASRTGLLTITLEQGGEPKLERLLFEVSPSADFTDIARKLSADGVQSEVRSDSFLGIRKVLASNHQIP